MSRLLIGAVQRKTAIANGHLPCVVSLRVTPRSLDAPWLRRLPSAGLCCPNNRVACGRKKSVIDDVCDALIARDGARTGASIVHVFRRPHAPVGRTLALRRI